MDRPLVVAPSYQASEAPSAPHAKPARRRAGAVLWGRVLVVATCAALVAAVVVVAVKRGRHGAEPPLPPGQCRVFCGGDLFEAMQRNAPALFNGSSKVFVDMPLLVDPDEAEDAFAALPAACRDGRENCTSELRGILDRLFASPGSDMDLWTPADWAADPPFLAGVADARLRAWGREVHAIWKVLGRRVSPAVAEHPERHSLLPLPHGFVVPGGRFREVYYWDSYWIVRGLLAGSMRATARGMVLNLLALVREHGFVPNGSRRYYLDRSQPPFLTQMVDAVASAPPSAGPADPTFLAAALPLLDREYEWWTGAASRHHVPGGLARYYCNVTWPRPESYNEDVATAAAAGGGAAARDRLYSELCAGGETGWDFSSRWFADRATESTIDTTRVLPSDLNAVMYRNELTLARLHDEAGSPPAAAAAYRDAAARRLRAVQEQLWDAGTATWRDRQTGALGPADVLSNFAPIWGGLLDGAVRAGLLGPDDVGRAVDAVRGSALLHGGGMATTRSDTGQQWDGTNAWAPLQHMLVEGLAALEADGADPRVREAAAAANASALATELAQRWVSSNFLGYNRTGQMFEKYNAEEPGESGGGGEYLPVVGFGWTNGCALSLLQTYGDVLKAP